ncbi:MAG: hypothetical protein ABSF22_26530, partial [Bryobacteraceae bacterium]
MRLLIVRVMDRSATRAAGTPICRASLVARQAATTIRLRARPACPGMRASRVLAELRVGHIG